MVIKVYISGISGNKEVKKHQQRVQMILDSKNIEYVTVDITEPGNEDEKTFMQQNSNPKNSKHALPPQLFNEDVYCGDYEDFDLANEVDDLDNFLKLSPAVSKAELTLEKSEPANKTIIENGEVNGNSSSRENSAEKIVTETAADGSGDREDEKTDQGEAEVEEEEE